MIKYLTDESVFWMWKDIYDNPERKKQTLLEESSRLGFQKGVMGAPDPDESGRLLVDSH